MGQNGIFKNDQGNAVDISSVQLEERQPAKSLVIGRPILLALEDIDGTPSFLEKALRFLEEYGVKIEGILRQAADVDDVEHRIREYEKGKSEFSPEEDPHVIADCVKYVLRELPSSPVPASCCNALLEAFRTDRGMRLNAMRTAICETFPEPNRCLLQRILMMMQEVASNKAVNRMSISAVAACMAPLLLRPLLAGDCDLDNGFDMGGDGSVQLMQAAAAANHAQAIVITLLEEYENIFGDGPVTPEPYTDSEDSESESEEITDDDDDSFDDDGDDDATEDSVELRATDSETKENEYSKKVTRSHSSGSESPKVDDVLGNPPQTSLLQHDSIRGTDSILIRRITDAKKPKYHSCELLGVDNAGTSMLQKISSSSQEPVRSIWRPTVWGRTPARKNLSMESIEFHFEDESEIQKLESVKIDLQNRISNEAKTNSLLQDSQEKQKDDLHERRLALEKDVSRLQEQLQKDMELRAALEAGCGVYQLPQSVFSIVDEKMKADLEEIAQAEADVLNLKQKADDLELQLNQQREQNSRIRHDRGKQYHQSPDHQKRPKEKQIGGGVIATKSTSENLPRSKHEPNLDIPNSDKYKKQESPASSSKPLMASTVEAVTNKFGTTGSRKSSGRGEGTNSTHSALSKLTNRLNFLKERRSQIASELHNMDKGRGSEYCQSLQNMNKRQESLEKSRDIEGQSLQNVDKDKGRKSEGLPNLDTEKSESFPVVDKGRSKITPRTRAGQTY
ncbi:hypothetical protein ACJIZ3_003170 [Penstemon smallii]|uniref:Rho-GAP domain-containing protein n=1 Tax=Penstemon smallii TaxID=265156 RepID=A0ABD3UBW7_9LAMI